ncbi:DUF726 domain-containing protein, partial [Pseudomonas syringae pv. tagetis]
TEDHVLLLNQGDKSLGRTPLEHFENVRMPRYSQHNYWRRMQDVLIATRFSGSEGLETGVAILTTMPRAPGQEDIWVDSVLGR